MTQKKPGDVKPGDVAKRPVVPGRPGLPGTVAGKKPAADGLKVVGAGWTSVVVAKLPTATSSASSKQAPAIAGVLKSLPVVKGSWGSGHLLKGSLFSILITDDGRVLAGAVAPEKLYEAAGK